MTIDLASIVLPDVPPLEIVLRGTRTYLGIFLLLRVTLKRESGAAGLPDLLLVVLIADAAQDAMAGQYRNVGDGLLLVAVIIAWSVALDWIGDHVPAVQRFVHPPPLLLVRDGKLQARNLRAELLTRDELMSHLRAQGVGDIEEVERAYLEGDGQLTVVKRDRGDAAHERRRATGT